MGTVIATGALAIVFYILFIFGVTWAWNTVIAGLFGGPVIEWWHAAAMLILLGVVKAGISRGDG
jgi:hypothetical protein